jgi:hypothetical protein
MKNFKLFILIGLIFTSHYTLAARFKWEIQVTDPEFELNYKTLGDGGFKPFLSKTSWRCYVGPITEKNSIEMRKIRCNYSIKKTGKVTTLLSCSDQKTYDEVTLELFDEKKNLTFSIMLICRKK